MPELDIRRAEVAERLERVKDAVTPQIVGGENVPAGRAVIAFNHPTAVNLLMPKVGERRIHFVAGRSPQQAASARGWLQRTWRIGLPNPDPDPLADGLDVLESEGLVGIHPEAGRSPDGRLYRGHTVVAELALAAGAPVVPAAVVVDSLVGRLLAPTIVLGQPLDLSRFADLSDRALALRTATDAVMSEILALSGQVYVDVEVDERREQLSDEKRRRSEALRARAAAEKAERVAAEQEARFLAAREVAEMARIQAEAAEAAREHARRAAEQDERRRARQRGLHS